MTRNRMSTSTNHGVTAKYPCGNLACKAEVTKEGIQCDACLKWYHRKCGRIEAPAFKIYTEKKILKWVCQACINLIKGLNKTKVEDPKSNSPSSPESSAKLNKEADCKGPRSEGGNREGACEKGTDLDRNRTDPLKHTNIVSNPIPPPGEWIEVKRNRQNKGDKGARKTKTENVRDSVKNPTMLPAQMGAFEKLLEDHRRVMTEIVEGTKVLASELALLKKQRLSPGKAQEHNRAGCS